MRGVRGPLIRAGRAGQPECRGIIATRSTIPLGCRGRGRTRPSTLPGDRFPPPSPSRPVRERAVTAAAPRRSPRVCAAAVQCPADGRPRSLDGAGSDPATCRSRSASVPQPAQTRRVTSVGAAKTLRVCTVRVSAHRSERAGEIFSCSPDARRGTARFGSARLATAVSHGHPEAGRLWSRAGRGCGTPSDCLPSGSEVSRERKPTLGSWPSELSGGGSAVSWVETG